jgi:hypothetical protein
VVHVHDPQVGCVGVWVCGVWGGGVGVWGVWGVWGTFDIPQTALVATLDTYDFYKYTLLLKTSFPEIITKTCVLT